MKKLYTTLLVLLLAAAMGVGLWSLVDRDATTSAIENRELASKPSFSLSKLLDGSYVSELETYYSDTFPGRELLLKANQTLNKFYYFSGSEKNNMLVVDFTNDVGEGGQALEPTQPEQPSQTPEEPQIPEESEQTPTEPEEQEPETQQPNYDDMEVTSAGSIIILGTMALDIPTATDSIIERYAQAVNNIYDAVGDQTRVISLVTPNSGQFYSPTDYHTGSHDQKAMIDLCYSGMNDGVLTVDAYSVLEQHTDQDIFFRTDHHWTALGAYYAYTEFCKTAGFDSIPLQRFESGTYDRFVGSMYTYTSQYPQGAVLKENPDTLTYYLPLVETKASFYADADVENSVAYYCEVVNPDLPDDEYNKYMCFMSGDHPAALITTDVEGPACLVLKDSYGNAFLPFLTSHYSKIYVIDPREFNHDGKPSLDLISYVDQHEIDDVILVNYPFMINNAKYIKWLNRLVGLAYD